MSSITVGDGLESKIFDLIKSEIAAGRFFAKSECCKIFRKKGYYSKDRGKKIKFDISIEVFLPGSQSYSLLILIECKNYNHPVPVELDNGDSVSIEEIEAELPSWVIR